MERLFDMEILNQDTMQEQKRAADRNSVEQIK